MILNDSINGLISFLCHDKMKNEYNPKSRNSTFYLFHFSRICIFTTAVDEVVNMPVNFHNEIPNYKANFNIKQFSSVLFIMITAFSLVYALINLKSFFIAPIISNWTLQEVSRSWKS